jgi:hypothetical protein
MKRVEANVTRMPVILRHLSALQSREILTDLCYNSYTASNTAAAQARQQAIALAAYSLPAAVNNGQHAEVIQQYT